MNLLDEQYTKTPFYGVRNMTTYLRGLQYAVGKDHVRTLLRKMGLTASSLSQTCQGLTHRTEFIRIYYGIWK